MNLAKRRQLDQLRQQILADQVCPELAAGATNLVMGDGNLDAEIVLIGEAPGRREDEAGMPFVGASGKLLDEMLASINLNRSDIYITNIVKYRPPANRDPSRAEKAEFWPYLERQITIIDPRLVVTLGRHSLECFIPGSKIGQVHGELLEIVVGGARRMLLPLYHPAAALYDGRMRPVLFADFAAISSAFTFSPETGKI